MIWVQLIGFVGVALLIVMFQVNDRKKMLRIQMASALTMAIHFALLGATTGAALNVLRAMRNFFFIRYREHAWLLPVTVSVFLSVGVITWHDWTSIFPMIGSTIGTMALWQKKPHVIRFLSLIVPPFWFTYNFLNGSYAGMIGDTVVFTSALAGIYRFDIAPRLRRLEPALHEVEAAHDDHSKSRLV